MKMQEHLRAPKGVVRVEDFDPAATPGFKGDKSDAKTDQAELAVDLALLQEKLYANGTSNGADQALLLVLQGMDTSGKGGVIKHVIGQVDPQGVRITSFKKPTEEERSHDFLWRIQRGVPTKGQMGIFDRSHYEDVLIQRVESMASPDEIERRYGAINEFEQNLAESGVRIIKCFLNVSKEKQGERLLERLDDPHKHWKYNPGDLQVRQKWDAYMDAYGLALSRCNEDAAPWYVIPADIKWYRNWAITALLTEVMEEMDLHWPAADFDVELEKSRVLAS